MYKDALHPENEVLSLPKRMQAHTRGKDAAKLPSFKCATTCNNFFSFIKTHTLASDFTYELGIFFVEKRHFLYGRNWGFWLTCSKLIFWFHRKSKLGLHQLVRWNNLLPWSMTDMRSIMFSSGILPAKYRCNIPSQGIQILNHVYGWNASKNIVLECLGQQISCFDGEKLPQFLFFLKRNTERRYQDLSCRTLFGEKNSFLKRKPGYKKWFFPFLTMQELRCFW